MILWVKHGKTDIRLSVLVLLGSCNIFPLLEYSKVQGWEPQRDIDPTKYRGPVLIFPILLKCSYMSLYIYVYKYGRSRYRGHLLSARKISAPTELPIGEWTKLHKFSAVIFLKKNKLVLICYVCTLTTPILFPIFVGHICGWARRFVFF
jgi:hypothetical protein